MHLSDGTLAAEAPAHPANYLLMGADTTGKIAKDDLPDTMMVLHVDPVGGAPLLVSFPRDLMVNVPGHGRAQLNAVFAFGGADLMIKTLQSDFNIPINHYIQVDFAGFQSNVTCAAPPPSESELFGAPDETPVEPPPTRWLGGVSWHTDRTTF